MKTKLAAAFILFIFILSGIQVQAEEQTRKVDQFTSISLRMSAHVQLEQGGKQNLEIVAKTSTLEEIITEVKEGELIIRFPNKNYFLNDFDSGEITIYITVPEIKRLAVSGSGDIIAEDEIKAKSLDLAVSGSGNITLIELSAEKVNATISGSGSVTLAGKTAAKELSATISGSGNLKAQDFKADDVNVKVSGSGNVSIEASENLNVRVSGSGNVNYKGNPAIDSSISGSGKIRDVN